MTRRAFRLADAVVLAAVLLFGALALLFIRTRDAADTVWLYVNGKETASFSLKDPPAEEYTVQTEHGTLTLSFRDGGVCAVRSDCPDGVCVRTGVIRKKGESIVCVPLGVTLTAGGGALDGVTG